MSARAQQFEKRTEAVTAMLDKLQVCNDAQIELVLSRACLGVSKINHMLRASGFEMRSVDGLLAKFDEVQDMTLRRLCPG
eukprot:5945211-Karenia_brevis.AAC.1